MIEAHIREAESARIEGFRRAAELLIDAAAADYRTPDNLFFPIAYLYRHHLELTLKELVRLGVQSGDLSDCDDILKDHKLEPLWVKAKELIIQVWPSSSSSDDLEAVENVILEFHSLDKSGQRLRYAFSKDGKSFTLGIPSRIDLQNMKSVLESTCRFLDVAIDGIAECDPGYGE